MNVYFLFDLNFYVTKLFSYYYFEVHNMFIYSPFFSKFGENFHVVKVPKNIKKSNFLFVKSYKNVLKSLSFFNVFFKWELFYFCWENIKESIYLEHICRYYNTVFFAQNETYNPIFWSVGENHGFRSEGVFNVLNGVNRQYCNISNPWLKSATSIFDFQVVSDFIFPIKIYWRIY